jgi:hypothetical protein
MLLFMMLDRQELIDYWQPKLVRNLDEVEDRGLEWRIGTLTVLNVCRYGEQPGTDFTSGSVTLLDRCLRIDGYSKKVHLVREYAWEEITSLTFVHKWPDEHAVGMKLKEAAQTQASFRKAIDSR